MASDHSAIDRMWATIGSIEPGRLRRVARLWCIVAGGLLALYLLRQTQAGLTDGSGRPFGEDFLNFWSAARLGISGRVAEIYDLARFHRFEESIVRAPIDIYHYSYPPVMLLVTAPLGLLPYLAAWFVWQIGGWLAFALALKRIRPAGGWLVALALPAVFVNAIGGQNGCWTAAIIGWGLILLRSRPWLAGAILALFVVKPQLGWLIPLALLAGRQHRALGGFVVAAAALIVLTLPLFGVESWMDYARQGTMLKAVILENGSGTWHRMISIFVLVRHLGAPIAIAYGAQMVASAIVAWLVLRCWRRDGAGPRAYAVLVIGMLAGSLYVSDYDCVMAGLAAAWLWDSADAGARGRIGLATITPLFAAPLALASGIALGALALWPMLLGSQREGGGAGRARGAPGPAE